MEELAKQFARLAEQYGPTVVDAAKEAARIEAYSTLAASALWAAAAAAFAWGAGKLFRAAKGPDADESLMMPASICLVIAILCAVAVAWTWIDPWTWTAINHPELYLAKKALKL